jgi:hypothetical protein
VQGDEVLARQVANQIALRDAVAEYGVSKIFTFHSTVKVAASFVAHGSEGVGTHLPEFDALHVSGAMPTAHREKMMQEFRRIDRGVMSNARCLTEGVDVPAVDMVAFLSPKKSKVDIVQAIGRAMRKSPDKEIGYVLVPLYLEQKSGESLEEAVARANFEEVWDILQSLQEQDEVLAELIRDMAVAKGSGKGFDDSRFSDRIAFTGPGLALESIRQAVTTRVLERLESSWDVNFGKLVKFKEEHGHYNAPKRQLTYAKLGNWIGVQRKAYFRGKLSNKRISRLERIDFEWDVLDSIWNQRFKELKDFYYTHQNFNVYNICKINPELGSWVKNQRSIYSRGEMPSDRIAQLEKLGFVWNQLDSEWDRMFERLEQFKREFGNCVVPVIYEFDQKLAYWVTVQRRNFAKGKMPLDKKLKLESLGFAWNKYSDFWEQRFEELRAYKAQHGDCRVPGRFKENKVLAAWVANQRSAYAKGNLPKEYIDRLGSLGFIWDTFSEDLDKWIAALKDFKDLHGHCRVPYAYKTNKPLAAWVNNQRQKYKKGKLTAEVILRLQEMDFEWALKSKGKDSENLLI